MGALRIALTVGATAVAVGYLAYEREWYWLGLAAVVSGVFVVVPAVLARRRSEGSHVRAIVAGVVAVAAGAVLVWAAPGGLYDCDGIGGESARAASDAFVRDVLAGDADSVGDRLADGSAPPEQLLRALPRAPEAQRDEIVAAGEREGGFCSSLAEVSGGAAEACFAYPARLRPTRSGAVHVAVSCDGRSWKVVAVS